MVHGEAKKPGILHSLYIPESKSFFVILCFKNINYMISRYVCEVQSHNHVTVIHIFNLLEYINLFFSVIFL